MQRPITHFARAQTSNSNSLTTPLNNNIVYLRDGDVVLYKRERSSVWQMRYRLYDKEWRRVSTKHRNIDYAVQVAGDIYDEARFRERLGLSFTRRKFGAIAKV
jgi:hypothetical protein